MKSHSLHNIMFSDDRSWRWKRHVLFWLAVFIYHVLRVGLFFPADKLGANLLSIFHLAFFRGLVLNVPFTCIIVYFVFPRYFQQKKYLRFVFGLLTAYLIMFTISVIWVTFFTSTSVANAIGVTGFWSVFRADIIRLIGNPPLICGLFLSLKILKNWHLEQVRTEVLAKENASAELQLLKAQIHPHFLFNTLNNIYSYSLNRSPQAGALVRKLSEMLGYMINECEGKLVPLERELKLIEDYMGLEKIRYGKRLNMEVNIHGDFENKSIAPLLMVPFIENSFKHGTSQMLREPWVRLEITVIGNQLFFKLKNSKPSVANPGKQNKGIGLINVKKRLQLLYPGKHQLDIHSTANTFSVNMQLLLEENVLATKIVAVPNNTAAYA